MLKIEKIKQFIKKTWFSLWLISLIICFIIGLLLPRLPIQILLPDLQILVDLYVYFFVFISVYGSLLVGVKIVQSIGHGGSLNMIKSCFVILIVLMVSIPLLIISSIWYVGGDLLFRTYIPFIETSSGNNDPRMDMTTAIVLEDYNQITLFTLFIGIILFLISGTIFQFLVMSSSAKIKDFRNYVFSVETIEKINKNIEKIRILFILLILSLSMFLILFVLMQEIGFELIRIIFNLGYALFFIILAIYNGVCVYLALKLWEKVETVFQNSLKISKTRSTNDSSPKDKLFQEIHLQINASDSYLWSLIVFAIPLLFWGILACSTFKLGSISAIIIISGSLLFSIIFPYQYINHYIKTKSVNYLIEYDLPDYVSSLKEILGFRNAIISIFVPLFGVFGFFLSLIG